MVELKKDFERLEPFTFGPEGHKQFYKHHGKIACLRESCDGCKFKDNGCSFKEVKIDVDYIPNVRRGMAVESTPFLILKNKKPLSDISYLTKDQILSKYPTNLHFIFQDYTKEPLYIFKGQIRFYGSLSEFKNSKYINDFEFLKEYNPNMRLFSLDYSAIEPRLATLVIRDPNWVEVFSGSDKIVAKEVDLANQNLPLNSYNFIKNNKTFCVLSGELDKADYDTQCSKCSLKSICTVKQNFIRKVAGDWHSKNAEAFFGDSFINELDKINKKEMRSVAKAGGLALIYGAFEKTLAGVLGCSFEKASILKTNFFNALPSVVKSMRIQKESSIKNKYASNMFNRQYNLSELLNPKLGSKFKYRAESIALNHPIQSLGADFLKLGLLKSRDYIRKNELNFLSKMEIKDIDILEDLKVGLISSVHDEVVFSINDKYQDEILPDLYHQMRLDYLLDAFKAGFYLEMDCEYDEYRSWTSTSRYETSKIFILNELKNENSNSSIKEENCLVLELKDVSEEVLNKLINTSLENGVKVGLKHENSVFISDFFSSEKIIKELNLDYKKAYIK